MELCAVVLAAGQGKRMRVSLPKVLHPIGGKPMLGHVLSTAQALTASEPVVVHAPGMQAELEAAVKPLAARWAAQEIPRGTGDAVLAALAHVPESARVLVLYGDVPLISELTLKNFIEAVPEQAIGVLTVKAQNPTGLGRILRNKEDKIEAIVEEKDASPEQRTISEVNTGILLAPKACLQKWLPALSCDNAQQEYYLTDIISAAVSESIAVQGYLLEDAVEVMGVNDRIQWHQAEQEYQKRRAWHLIAQGVQIADPARLTIRGDVEIASDVTLGEGVILEGPLTLASGVTVGPYSILKSCKIESGVHIQPYTLIESAIVRAEATVGPYARLRPEADIGPNAKVGNFVELKKATLGAGSKVSHLSYVGDATIESNVNVGAGTIFCNYDGQNKHHTTVKAGAFIGSGSQLVAPVTIGEEATVGAGTTVTKDIPEHSLMTRRAKSRLIERWERPAKEIKDTIEDYKS